MKVNDLIARYAVTLHAQVVERVDNSGLVLVSPSEIFSIAVRLATRNYNKRKDENQLKNLILESVERVIKHYENQEKML